jgi:ElaB/YqjD/DUF883 family membrane-anchored ribosome-binding protein
MSTDPDVLRAQIDATRSELSSDVDALTEYVTPANVAHRQADKVRGKVGGAVTSMKEKVMGTASDVQHGMSSATSSTTGSVHDAAGSVHDSVAGAAHSVSGAAHQAPHAAASQTRGNPLAAGLIALGAGWLVASLLPTTAKEQQAASAVKDNASTLARPLTEAAKDAASNLRQPAQEAVASVKETATDAASTVRDEGASAAQHVQGQAADAKGTVQQEARR